MKVGIIPNISKTNILGVVGSVVAKIEEGGLEYFISDSLQKEFRNKLPDSFIKSQFLNHEQLFEKADLIISIGGDGTMLTTAFEAREYDTPMIGINFGKLGFLAELDENNLEELITDIKQNNYIIEERMALEAVKIGDEDDGNLYAINDIVIDKGRWPKMIEMTIKVDEDYVSTFAADGLIIATPTGSTGYSLSTGGPIVSPKTNAITLSPICPHTLTMRPLVLSCNQRISITVSSPHSTIQVNCDGQRVNYYSPPATFEIFRSNKSVKLIHIKSTNYFEILRKKLYWGLDIRNSNKSQG